MDLSGLEPLSYTSANADFIHTLRKSPYRVGFQTRGLAAKSGRVSRLHHQILRLSGKLGSHGHSHLIDVMAVLSEDIAQIVNLVPDSANDILGI